MPPKVTPPAPNDNCPPVWQYLLVMSNELKGLSSGLQAIGQYHKPDELQELAVWLDEVVGELRTRVEKLTGWTG